MGGARRRRKPCPSFSPGRRECMCHPAHMPVFLPVDGPFGRAARRNPGMTPAFWESLQSTNGPAHVPSRTGAAVYGCGRIFRLLRRGNGPETNPACRMGTRGHAGGRSQVYARLYRIPDLHMGPIFDHGSATSLWIPSHFRLDSCSGNAWFSHHASQVHSRSRARSSLYRRVISRYWLADSW